MLTVFIASGLPYAMEYYNRHQVDTEEIQSHFLFASGLQHTPLAPLQMGVVSSNIETTIANFGGPLETEKNDFPLCFFVSCAEHKISWYKSQG